MGKLGTSIIETHSNREELIEAIAQIAARYQAANNGHLDIITAYHRHIATSICDGDAESLEHILMTPDPSMKQVFMEATGIRLPSSYKQAWSTLRTWGGISSEWQEVRDAAWASNNLLAALTLSPRERQEVKAGVEAAFSKGFTEVARQGDIFLLKMPGTSMYWGAGEWATDVRTLRYWLIAYGKFWSARETYRHSMTLTNRSAA